MQLAGPYNGTATLAGINITNGVFKVIDTALVPPANATTVRAVASGAASAAGNLSGFEAFYALAGR